MSEELKAGGAEDLESLQNVSRETFSQLKTYISLLKDWQTRMNLVSAASLGDIWRRHVADSAQLADLIPKGARIIVDLGSGAGFPGLVLAILLARRPGLKVHLVEAKAKKCAFLRAATAATGAPAVVHHSRIEDVRGIKADVVVARALAPLDKLLAYAGRFVSVDSIMIFPKGKSAERELEKIRRKRRINAKLAQSRTDPESKIIVVRGPLDARR